MHLKRFRAATMEAALQQIRKDLGEDAMILDAKHIPHERPGGYGTSNLVEVVAALDDDPAAEAQEGKHGVHSGTAERDARQPMPGALNRQADPRRPTSDPSVDLSALQQELRQLKGMVSGYLGRGSLPPDLPDALGRMYWSLLAQEVDERIARRWVTSMRDRRQECPSSAQTPLLHSLADIVAQDVIGERVRRVCSRQRVVALVGPTGVGKTTTIAKLAAGCRFREGKRVALITTDTYRITGARQLQTYAELIGLPCYVAPLPADLKRALANERDADVLLIDTVGRSARRHDQLEELAAYVRGQDGCEVHLVLSATTKRADLLQAIEGYSVFNFSSIIATKLDETAVIGPVLEAAMAAAAPISYLTTGQEVPDDIEDAHPLRLAERLIGAPGRHEEGI